MSLIPLIRDKDIYVSSMERSIFMGPEVYVTLLSEIIFIDDVERPFSV